MNESFSRQRFPWKLMIFPALEGLFFILSITSTHLISMFVSLLFAALFLSYSIHVFFHECVHVRTAYPTLFNMLGSVFLGLPFDGYRVHHYNHHSHGNSLDDFSTTWLREDDQIKGFSPCRYALGWPRQLVRAMDETQPFSPEYGDPVDIKRRIPPQILAILTFPMVLSAYDWRYAMLYFLLIYLGWAISALHNYGQHPPLAEDPISTYANPTYNLLFFNNGMHWEHHNKPWLPWYELEPDKESFRIGTAHFIYPCYQRRIT